jgi:hypothetical protein
LLGDFDPGDAYIDDIIIKGTIPPTGMLIQSTSGGTGSLLNNSAGVTATVERYLTTCVGSTGTSCWHYVASPITNALSAVFKDDYLRWYNTTNGAWSSEYTQLDYPLTVMKGFAISEQGSAGTPPHTNHYFTGELNTSVPAYSLALTGSTGLGWNLVGNPYPSAIDIESSGITWNNVQSTVWFLQKSSGNYLVYPKGGSGATTTQYIPSMQGFFVYANGTSPSITLSNTARVHNNTAYYKEYLAPNTQDVLYLKAQRLGSELYDLVSVVFRDYTSVNYEDIYDAQKLYGSAEAPQLYTVSADNVSLTINSLPFTGKNNTIPLNLNIFENGSGNYAITASNLESFRSGTTIMIEDKKEAKTQDLTFNPVYNFTYASGDDPARFLLHFANPFFSTGEDVKNQDLQIYSFGNAVYLKDLTGNPEKGEMFIYNMIGQEISHNQVDGIQLNKYTFDLPTGYYIVRVITKEKSFNSRVFLN